MLRSIALISGTLHELRVNMDDDEQFENLMNQYHRLVMSLIYRYYGGQLGDRAEDLAQEVWTRLWESFKNSERNIISFKSYLYRTVQTTLWDAVRTLEKDRQLSSFEDEEPADESKSEHLHQKLALESLLNRLTPDEARIIRAHLKGFTTDEIANLMACSEGRARNLLSRIKKKLIAMGGSLDAHFT